MTDFSQLPEWTCHKVVRAAKIVGFSNGWSRVTVTLDDNYSYVDYDARLAAGSISPVEVSEEIFLRGKPVAGDYLVAYNVGTKDEYISWSPAAVFEDGYSKGRLATGLTLGAIMPILRPTTPNEDPRQQYETHKADLGGNRHPLRPVVGCIVLYRLADLPERDGWVPLLVTEVLQDALGFPTRVVGLAFSEGFPVDKGWIDHADFGADAGCWRWPERG